jgi:hypothetical protein
MEVFVAVVPDKPKEIRIRFQVVGPKAAIIVWIF